MKFALRSIGKVRTPYQVLDDCPRNIDPDGPICELNVDDDYLQGLVGLAPGDDILVLYWLHESDRGHLLQRRRESGQKKGVFALRSSNRPNPIGAAVVRVESINGGCIRVRGMDCLDRTALLDIKPAFLKPGQCLGV